TTNTRSSITGGNGAIKLESATLLHEFATPLIPIKSLPRRVFYSYRKKHEQVATPPRSSFYLFICPFHLLYL
ncbi:MAG: hypothetical protein ACT6FG_05030, partial [Methanosarcinaceae archaeon]